MYKLLGAFLVLAGIGILYLAASADRAAQNEPEGVRREVPKSPMRTETIEAAARGAWRAIPDAAAPAEPAVPVTPAARVALPANRDTASPPIDRTVLIRDLQRELKRIGCYEGERPTSRNPHSAEMCCAGLHLHRHLSPRSLLARSASSDARCCGNSVDDGPMPILEAVPLFAAYHPMLNKQLAGTPDALFAAATQLRHPGG